MSVFGTIDDTSAGVVTTYNIDGSVNTVVSPAGSGDTYKQVSGVSPVHESPQIMLQSYDQLFWQSAILGQAAQ